MGVRELFEAARVQYQQRITGRPYLSPEQMPESVKHYSFDGAELAELMYQIKHISWKDYVMHARKLVPRPELAYDYVNGKPSRALDRVIKKVLENPTKPVPLEKPAE